MPGIPTRKKVEISTSEVLKTDIAGKGDEGVGLRRAFLQWQKLVSLNVYLCSHLSSHLGQWKSCDSTYSAKILWIKIKHFVKCGQE